MPPYDWTRDDIFPWLIAQDGGYYLIPPTTGDSVQFRLIAVLGQGGQGRVYLAMQIDNRKLGHLVAIKCFLPNGVNAQDQMRLADMAVRERDRTKQQSDERFVQVHAVGQDVIAASGKSLLWYSMDYIPGRTLKELIRTWRRLPQSMAIVIAEEICKALIFLHEQPGVVIHRDLKPDNIKLDGSRRQSMILLDLGLALDIFVATSPPVSSSHTLGSLLCGTLGYMAPERFDPRKPQSVQSDFWSLGVILYEMLTGERALTCSGDWHTAARETAAFVPMSPQSIVPDLDDAVCQLCVRLMSPAPANRPSNAREILQDLSQCRGRVHSQKVNLDPQWVSLWQNVNDELDRLKSCDGESLFCPSIMLCDSDSRDRFRDTICLWNSLATTRVVLQFTQEQCATCILQDVAQSSQRLKAAAERLSSMQFGTTTLEQISKELRIEVNQLTNSLKDLKQLFITSLRPFQTILTTKQTAAIGIGTEQALLQAKKKFLAIQEILFDNDSDSAHSGFKRLNEYLETEFITDIYAWFDAVRILDEAVMAWMNELLDGMVYLSEAARG